MADSSDNTSKLIWFFAGAAIGASIALLYAPTTGEELRRRIGEKTDEGRQALAEGGKDIVDRGRDLYERGRRIAEDAADMFDKGRKLASGEQA
jgi:gas vesicle protein